ncbi:hypothetical protein [Piscinibacter gummiphilus]|uniref:Uncharacterized protein n=1 Tax=Piscinibacter gummiphilus TaxID=946333 RepID=A0ABZ0CNE0_9BURK|nr:hypothetical protein [Piscinibacter gummiphilus]WOB06505.1 hypothetical protein RXV79_16405 [Piscinibacter gummiphilus]
MSRPRNFDVPSKEVHAYGPQEHSLCGLAPEAYESGDHHETVVFAEPGQVVNCELCRQFIDHVRDSFKGYRAKAGGAS